MLMVMILHVTYALMHNDESSFWGGGMGIVNGFVNMASIVCVNLFILISGWFGIRFKAESIIKLLYQTVFLSLFVYLAICLFKGGFSLLRIWHCTFGVFSMLWFVWAYILLCILAPILNAFCESATKTQFRTFLICFYSFVIFCYCTLRVDPIFSKGFHTMAFIGLYMLARYMRLYSPLWAKWDKKIDLLVYLVTVIIASLVLLLAKKNGWAELEKEKLGNYIAPTCLIGSVYLFLFFSKIEFKSALINKLAISCFAAYVIHQQFDAQVVYNNLFVSLYNNCSHSVFWLLAIPIVILIYLLCAIVDRLRIFTYNLFRDILVKK